MNCNMSLLPTTCPNFESILLFDANFLPCMYLNVHEHLRNNCRYIYLFICRVARKIQLASLVIFLFFWPTQIGLLRLQIFGQHLLNLGK